MANRPKRPQPGEGRTSHANIDGSAIAAAFGGGGKTAGYDQASSEVQAGTLSSPGDDYDPRAATSARGVLTPELQKAYDTGPTQPLNWLGKAARLPDLYSQFQMQKAVSSINLDHDKQMEAIRHSNLTDAQKQQAALQASNQKADRVNATYQAYGIPPTDEFTATATSAIRPMIPQLAASGAQLGINKNTLGANEAGKENAFLMSPEGGQAHTANLFSKAAAQAAVNSHLGASSWAALHPVLGPGSAMMSSDLFGPGTSVVNDKAPTMQEQMMARAMGMPTPGPNELMFSKFGERYNIGPKNPMGASAGQLLGPGFGVGQGPSGAPPTATPPVGQPAPAAPMGQPLTFSPAGGLSIDLPAIGQAIGNGLGSLYRNANQPYVPGYGFPAPGMAPQAPTMADLIKQQEEEKRRQLMMPSY